MDGNVVSKTLATRTGIKKQKASRPGLALIASHIYVRDLPRGPLVI